jgi:DNA-binding MarR family transcriptional regulator
MQTESCELPDERYEPGSMGEVFQLMDQVAKKLTRLQRDDIGTAELTPAQYSILGLLWDRDGRQFNELSTACCCSPSTVTGVVDTLEKKGLVSREPNPMDRRSVLVTLTEEGRLLEGRTPTLDMIFGDCCRSMEPEELQQLSGLLRKLNDALEK